MEITVVTVQRTSTTFITNNASEKEERTSETDLSPKISDTDELSVKKNRQNTISKTGGKKSITTAAMPATPTLLRISDEYA